MSSTKKTSQRKLCPKCRGRLKEGIYLKQTYTGSPDFPGTDEVVTFSPGGPCKIASCLKCPKCGFSILYE